MEFQSYLSQKYQGHDSFLQNIIFPIFGEDNFESSYDVELLDSDELRGQAARTGIRSIIRCGTIDLDLTPIEVFDITVSDRLLMDRNRVGVQAVIRRVMDTYSGAFMIIHYDNDVKWDWRFTFCQMKDKGEFTDNKRYTFLLGPNQSCRTAAQNFQKLADLHEDITIKDIVAAFDVEALSRSFFDDYKKQYERFVMFITGKRFEKDGGKFVEKTMHNPHPVYYPAFDCDDKSVRDYTKLLLARIVFLHFLQKKGWLGVPKGGKWGDGDEQFMKHLYERSSEEQKEDFLESVLEPLFFDALNGDRSTKKDVFDTKVVGEVRVPYLNGGLFNRKNLDDIVIRYPKEFFGDFLEFLYQYNFTIDENDPNEAQVGIDPEMLGKIFENLLEDNKDKGAYYTPKEIVQYMCQESLIAFLDTNTGFGEERLRSFVKDPFVHVSEFTSDEQYAILGAILNVKICDPAIGSGAFPIGLLNELVRCKEAIYGDEKGRAEIKKEIIRDNIYGVDIEKGAVDIARLRFWLSLIVDEEEPLPLPNLDYKIMQGNSLLERYDGVDLSHLVDAGETNVFMSGSGELKDDLAKSLKKYFGETNHAKKKDLKEHISETIKKILDVAGVEIPDGIDVTENNHFFLWHTWFADVFEDGGFDIYIGNPPYIQLQNNEGAFGKLYKDSGFETFAQTGDIYCLFYEQGWRQIKDSGHLCFITSNKWLKAAYGTKLRGFLSQKSNPRILIDFAGVQVFESAMVDTNIILFMKGVNQHNTKSVAVSKADIASTKDPSEFMKRAISCSFDSSDVWSVEAASNPIMELVNSRGVKLKDWDIQINYGIKTGFNEGYIITKEQRDDILSRCNSDDEYNRTDEIIRPILKNDTVRAYSIQWDNKYLINLHNGYVKQNGDVVGPCKPEEFPAVVEYINAVVEEIESGSRTTRGGHKGYNKGFLQRTDCGLTPYNLRPCKYVDLLYSPKIIWKQTSSVPTFTFDDSGYFLDVSGQFLSSKTLTDDGLKALIGVLNSKLAFYWFLENAVAFGSKGVRWVPKTVFEFPVPPSIVDNEELIELVNSLLSQSVVDKNDILSKIDILVYSAYSINDGDVCLIEKYLSEKIG